jgi:hypothetical protein
MEKITMIYEFNEDEGTDMKRVEMMRADQDDCGLRCGDVCEMFTDFMDSVGFSENSVWSYFKE